ncbi:hypothetical protein IKE79_00240 [Candidatus Saccharibacteria bacterium]|nr:hypothetical protein [Candidatus Saccharibacteria bacterium]
MKQDSEGTPNPLNPRSRMVDAEEDSPVMESVEVDQIQETDEYEERPERPVAKSVDGMNHMARTSSVSARVLNGGQARRASISRANRRPMITEAMISESMMVGTVPVPAAGAKSGGASRTADTEATSREMASGTAAGLSTKAVASEKGGKKKAMPWLILGLILLLAGIGCGVAAWCLKPECNNDKVTAAVLKLLSGDLPRNISVDGEVSVTTTGGILPFSDLQLDFTTDIDLKTTNQSADISVTTNLTDGQEFSFDASEVHLAEGDLYLRLDGVAGALTNYVEDCSSGNADCAEETAVKSVIADCDEDETDCVEAIDCDDDLNCLTEISTTDYGVLDSVGLFEVIEGEWIRIPNSDFSSVESIVDINILEDSPAQCLIDAAGNLGSYQKNLTENYKNSAFVTYSTENLPVVRKKYDLYRLGFDNEKLAGFINSLSNKGFMNEMVSCLGGEAVRTTVTAEQVAEITAELPTIYVEIDSNYNFTRAYLTMANDTDTAVADLQLSYPDKLTIEEPSNYISISEALTKVLSQFYSVDDITASDED